MAVFAGMSLQYATVVHAPAIILRGCGSVVASSQAPALRLSISWWQLMEETAMLKQPHTKYRAFPPVGLKDRTWPDRTLTRAPIWMSTDLRDGNQALFEPMNAERKLRLFKTLCAIGFKEIEVGFPSASQTDFDFVRTLIEGNHVPDDVTIEVLTQARDPLILRTMESLRGARRAIVHVYNATAPTFRSVVFGMSKDAVVRMAVGAVERVRELAAAQPDTEWLLEYSPETFTATELDFSRTICDAVAVAWGATPQRKIIITLPATAEYCTQLPIHPRHPYVGDLVFTAFSGSHQDAIKKGMAAQRADAMWDVPYLPIAPAAVGRSYEYKIRNNSQSGKRGGADQIE